MPIGNFVLTAAGDELDIDTALLTLGAVMTRTNEGFEKNIRAQVAEKVTEHGIEQDKLLAHHGARLKIMLAMNVGKTTAQSDPTNEGKA